MARGDFAQPAGRIGKQLAIDRIGLIVFAATDVPPGLLQQTLLPLVSGLFRRNLRRSARLRGRKSNPQADGNCGVLHLTYDSNRSRRIQKNHSAKSFVVTPSVAPMIPVAAPKVLSMFLAQNFRISPDVPSWLRI